MYTCVFMYVCIRTYKSRLRVRLRYLRNNSGKITSTISPYKMVTQYNVVTNKNNKNHHHHHEQKPVFKNRKYLVVSCEE